MKTLILTLAFEVVVVSVYLSVESQSYVARASIDL